MPDIGGAELSLRISATSLLVIDACFALVCILKGKYRSGLFGLFLAPVGLIGAVRLARPNSIDRRWKPVLTDWEDVIGGRPSQPDPLPGPATEAGRRRGLPACVPGTRKQNSQP